MQRVLYAALPENHARLARVIEKRQLPLTLDTVASSGALLDRLAADRTYDVILIDREIPTLGGVRVVQLVVATGYPAPVIVLAREADARTADAIIAAGAADFVVRRGSYAEAMPRIIREAIETFRSRESVAELARRQAELDALLALQRRLYDATDLWETFGQVAEHLNVDCPYDRLIVWRREEEDLVRAVFVAGRNAEPYQAERRPLNRTLVPRAIEAGKPVVSRLNEPDIVPHDMIVAAVAVLAEDGRPVGALEVQSATTFYNDKHLAFLGAIAEQITAALSLAARRREELQARERAAQTEALRQLTLAITRQLEPALTVLSADLALIREPSVSPERVATLWQEVDRAIETLSRRLRLIRLSAETGSGLPTGSSATLDLRTVQTPISTPPGTT